MSRAKLVRGAATRGFEITHMSEHDLLEVVEIEEECGLSLWGWDAYRAELDRPEAVALVARAPCELAGSGRTVGGFVAARLNADELHVNNIGVRPGLRRMGLGRALLGRALDEGARRGAGRSVLEVRAGNRAAQELYAGLGFAVVGERRDYYRGPAEDALVMVRPLGRSS